MTQARRELAVDGETLTNLVAADRLSGEPDSALEAKVRLAFGSGDYETAAFTAMKEVRCPPPSGNLTGREVNAGDRE